MPIHIPLTHPVFALRQKMQEACQSFLTAHGFHYFQYLRCYADGSIGLLTNNTDLMEFAQQVDREPVVYSAFDDEQSNEYWFLWDEKLPDFPVRVAREKYNIRHGVTWVRRSKYYYDMIAVAMPREQSHLGSFYMNKRRAIEQFVGEFEKKNKDLIDIMNKAPIILPAPYRDTNYQKICLQSGRIYCAGKHGDTYVTAQEMACLRLYFQGESYKAIAQTLGISHRTVETYLSRVRERSGYFLNSDLEKMFFFS